MNAPTLHSVPRASAVTREQIRAIGLRLRWPMAAGIAFLALITLVFQQDILGERIDFHPEQLLIPGILGFVLPIGIWFREDHFGHGFFWTLPVDRGRHALTRVFAGWVWLMAVIAVFLLWQLLLTVASGGNILGVETLKLLPSAARARLDAFPYPSVSALDVQTLESLQWRPVPLLWLTPFTAATGAYLLTSALTLGVRLRWIAAFVLGFFLLGAFGEMADIDLLFVTIPDKIRTLMIGPYGFDTLLTARTEFLKVGTTLASGENIIVWRAPPNVRQWAIATALWLAVGLIAVYLAALRHREQRRN